MQDSFLREQLVNFLDGQEAHMNFAEMVKDFPEDHINDIFPNGEYTFWELLEHIRLTQWVVLDFMTSTNYVELEWPKEYWPEKGKKATKKDWDITIKGFENDLKAIVKLVEDQKFDLSAKVPNGTGQIFLREFLLNIDHNAYHIGEFAIMRQVLNLWKKE